MASGKDCWSRFRKAREPKGSVLSVRRHIFRPFAD
jgi:hypothetical protein